MELVLRPVFLLGVKNYRKATIILAVNHIFRLQTILNYFLSGKRLFCQHCFSHVQMKRVDDAEKELALLALLMPTKKFTATGQRYEINGTIQP